MKPSPTADFDQRYQTQCCSLKLVRAEPVEG